MTLKIKKSRLGIFLYCPGWLTGLAVKKIIRSTAKRCEEQKENFVIAVPDKKTVKSIAKAVRSAKKLHGKIELISIEAADGTRVKVTL